MWFDKGCGLLTNLKLSRRKVYCLKLVFLLEVALGEGVGEEELPQG